MLENVPDIVQSTHGIRNIFANIRNVPTRPHMVLGMFLLAFSVPSPPWTPNTTATLTDDQKNRVYRTTITEPGNTHPTPYDIRVATHHDDSSAGSASVDTDQTHDPPGEDETDPPDAQYHNSTDDEEPQRHHHLNERTPQTINYSVGFPPLSHGPTTATGYPPPLENDTDTLCHPTYTASSRTTSTCWTPLTRSMTLSPSKNAYLHTHDRASPGQTISPQSHPYNAQYTRVFHPCTPTTNHTSKATLDPPDQPE